MQWSPLDVAVLDPAVDEFESHAGTRTKALIGNREKVEFTPEMAEWPVMNFPSCHKKRIEGHDNFRYLGQVAATVLFTDVQRELEFKRFLRDHVHLAPKIFDVAARIIARMGIYQYSSYHIRRNELQYKESFQSAQATLRNTEALLYENEPLYVATDETEEGFFDEMKKNRKIYRWSDFVGDDLKIDDMEIPKKLVGCIEQIICTGGRRFFGTQASTFTSYIFRLRGYIGAPDTREYWHNIRYTGLVEIDEYAQPMEEVLDGTDYMLEFPGLWEDLAFHNKMFEKQS